MGKMDEMVLCVPADMAFDDFEKFVERFGIWEIRRDAEKDMAYRHITPYCVLLREDGRILAYQRKKGNEERLEGQWSIGIGGHIHPSDGYGYEGILNGRDRECIEELGITPHKTFGEIYIQLNDTEVDKVHLGFAQIITEYNGELRPSNEIPCWEFLTVSELKKRNLETWAVYVLDLLEKDWGGSPWKYKKKPRTSRGI